MDRSSEFIFVIQSKKFIKLGIDGRWRGDGEDDDDNDDNDDDDDDD